MNEQSSNKKEEPELTLDVWTFICGIIGLIISWINMVIMYEIQINPRSAEIVKIFAYLSIIFTTSIPCIAIGLKNRLWGYGYIIGFAVAGIPFSVIIDLFIGWYTFFTSLFIFIIMWLIFWKGWRSLSSIQVEN
jgi:hypothetical protein